MPTPSEVAAQGWPQLFGGFILAPEVAHTCTSAGENRLIDFLLVSSNLRGLVTVYPYLDVPWGPHIGLAVEIDDRPVANQAQQAWCPKPLPSLKDLRQSHGFVEQVSTWVSSGDK